jgi:hypothetical protein
MACGKSQRSAWILSGVAILGPARALWRQQSSFLANVRRENGLSTKIEFE